MLSTEQQLTISIAQANEMIELRDALERLRKNPDYALIIDKTYLVDDAARVIRSRALACGAEQAAEYKDLDNQLTAMGHFQSFLSTIYQRGQASESALVDAEEELAEIRSYKADDVDARIATMER